MKEQTMVLPWTALHDSPLQEDEPYIEVRYLALARRKRDRWLACVGKRHLHDNEPNEHATNNEELKPAIWAYLRSKYEQVTEGFYPCPADLATQAQYSATPVSTSHRGKTQVNLFLPSDVIAAVDAHRAEHSRPHEIARALRAFYGLHDAKPK